MESRYTHQNWALKTTLSIILLHCTNNLVFKYPTKEDMWNSATLVDESRIEDSAYRARLLEMFDLIEKYTLKLKDSTVYSDARHEIQGAILAEMKLNCVVGIGFLDVTREEEAAWV